MKIAVRTLNFVGSTFLHIKTNLILNCLNCLNYMKQCQNSSNKYQFVTNNYMKIAVHTLNFFH